METLKRAWVPLLTLMTIMTAAVVIGLGIWTAGEGYSKRIDCFERLIMARKPAEIPGWRQDEKTETAELEALAWLLRKSHGTSVCTDSYTEQLTREVLSFEWRRVIDFRSTNPKARLIARRAFQGSYLEFNPREYRCATEYRYWLNPQPLWESNLVLVRKPVGRLKLYGPKDACEKEARKKSGRSAP